MLNDKIKISIIIPAYNEKTTLAAIIRRVQGAPLPYPKEILIVNDGSIDGTDDLVRKDILPRFDNIKYKELKHNRGKGWAVREALKDVTGDIVIIQDADLEYYPEDYAQLIGPIIAQESQVVYGSRILGPNSADTAHPIFLIGGKTLTWIFNVLYQTKLTDLSTCYKVFRKEVLDKVPLSCVGFEFCAEVTSRLIRMGYTIQEVPVRYSPRTIQEGKKIRPVHFFLAVWTIMKYRMSSRLIR